MLATRRMNPDNVNRDSLRSSAGLPEGGSSVVTGDRGPSTGSSDRQALIRQIEEQQGRLLLRDDQHQRLSRRTPDRQRPLPLNPAQFLAHQNSAPLDRIPGSSSSSEALHPPHHDSSTSIRPRRDSERNLLRTRVVNSLLSTSTAQPMSRTDGSDAAAALGIAMALSEAPAPTPHDNSASAAAILLQSTLRGADSSSTTSSVSNLNNPVVGLHREGIQPGDLTGVSLRERMLSNVSGAGGGLTRSPFVPIPTDPSASLSALSLPALGGPAALNALRFLQGSSPLIPRQHQVSHEDLLKRTRATMVRKQGPKKSKRKRTTSSKKVSAPKKDGKQVSSLSKSVKRRKTNSHEEEGVEDSIASFDGVAEEDSIADSSLNSSSSKSESFGDSERDGNSALLASFVGGPIERRRGNKEQNRREQEHENDESTDAIENSFATGKGTNIVAEEPIPDGEEVPFRQESQTDNGSSSDLRNLVAVTLEAYGNRRSQPDNDDDGAGAERSEES